MWICLDAYADAQDGEMQRCPGYIFRDARYAETQRCLGYRDAEMPRMQRSEGARQSPSHHKHMWFWSPHTHTWSLQ